MIILESIDQLESEEIFNKVIIESVSKRLHKYLMSRKNRQMLLDKYGKDAFLLPDELKFPVMNEKGKYDCGLIYAARVRAKQWSGKKPGYREVAKKAEELYKKHGCEKKIHILLNVNEHQEPVEIDFLELLDLVEYS